MGRRLRIRGALRRPHKKPPTESPKKDFARANLLTGLKSTIFHREGDNMFTSQTFVAAMLLSIFANRSKPLIPLLAAPAALLLSQGQAKAILTYDIFESNGNVVVQASGSLNLSGSQIINTGNCNANGAIRSSQALLCTGTDPGLVNVLGISGPALFNGTVDIFPASSVTGMFTILFGVGNGLGLDSSYISNAPIASTATFSGTTLANLGFTTSGPIGTWTLNGTSETIQVILGSPAASAVPGPLPLLGAGAAFGWSRRMRKRIASPLITPPQA